MERKKQNVSCPPVGDVTDNTERAEHTIPRDINTVSLKTEPKSEQIKAQQKHKGNAVGGSDSCVLPLTLFLARISGRQ